MDTALCIHGHFYQPPREDPWLGSILSEASAAPMRDWNERILRESYAPLAWARRLDASGRVSDIMNCYEWMSFNVGPTLLHWMRRNAPGIVERMREGDARSLARWGHGNAIAQIYHHIIMPLASPKDREVEVRWAIDDFRATFGREPEGMWLSEAAVDLASLEALAVQGIRFVILAPRQAKAVVTDGVPVQVNEQSVYIGEPYAVKLPSGATMTAVFYNGGLSQGIAFEGLLSDGELFWQRIAREAGYLEQNGSRPLLTLATDGETYGHHFTFGEMALAHVLAQGYARRDGIRLTNMAAFVAENPPKKEVILHEPSSWSCVHGVERWRSDCGCTDGGHSGWNQKWRGPLRTALNHMRSAVEDHFTRVGGECLTDPRAALLAYGSVLAAPVSRESFAATWFRKDADSTDRAWKLLAAQEQALAAFASCAWFFDDIARIEPENALTFALRAMDLMQETGGPDLHETILRDLDVAFSNQPDKGTGREVFFKDVLPRRSDAASQCLLALLLLSSQGRLPQPGTSAVYAWSRLSVEIFPEESTPPLPSRDNSHIPSASVSLQGVSAPIPLRGKAIIRQFFEKQGTEYNWECIPPSSGLSSSFVSLAEASVTVWTMNGPKLHSVVSKFSKPMRDYLMAQMAANQEALVRPKFLAQARHVLSMIDPWPEEQHDVIRPELYQGLMPYMAVEAVLNETGETLSPERRAQVEALLLRHLSPESLILANRLVSEAILERLASSGTEADPVLAELLRRAKALLPEMDTWDIQNKVWEMHPRSVPLLATGLRFRMD